MTDYFKTVRAYLRGKWGRKRKATEGLMNAVSLAGSVNPIQAARLGWIAALDIDIHTLRCRIESLRRAKKKHSHLQKQLDDLMNGRANITDQQTENTK